MAAAHPRRALVLSGGGARGAYEAGVLRYIFERLPQRLGHPPRIDVVTGTSVGAIHACFVAATAHLAQQRATLLETVWDGLRADVLFGSATQEILRLPGRMLDMLRSPPAASSDKPAARLYGLLDTERLEKVVHHAIPWRKIQANLAAGHLEAACVAATEISTGRVMVFVDRADLETVCWTNDPSVIARPAKLNINHALASASIPILFPAVRIGGSYYVDGGLRLNTPLSPAVRLGADRVLVIALRKGVEQEPPERERQRVQHFGNPLFLFGKVLNALLLDHIETDLSRMRLLNDVLRRVGDCADSALLDRINQTVVADRGQPFKIVDDLVLRPSEDLGILAGEVARNERACKRGGAALQLVLRALGMGDAPFEADLLSYLFFDASYTGQLMTLGFEDAKREEEALVGFFSD